MRPSENLQFSERFWAIFKACWIEFGSFSHHCLHLFGVVRVAMLLSASMSSDRSKKLKQDFQSNTTRRLNLSPPKVVPDGHQTFCLKWFGGSPGALFKGFGGITLSDWPYPRLEETRKIRKHRPCNIQRSEKWEIKMGGSEIVEKMKVFSSKSKILGARGERSSEVKHTLFLGTSSKDF